MTRPVYSTKFFEGQAPDSLRSAEAVVPLLIDLVHPASVLDVGCGTGSWLSIFQKAGIQDVLGVDGDWVDRSQLKIDAGLFKNIDLTKSFRLGRRFDLVTTLEVAEHLPLEVAAGFVESLVRHSDVVVFSAAIPAQGGTNHVNEQWPEYWADQFAGHRYRVFDILRPRIWAMKDVCYWYRQNILLFVNEQKPELATRIISRLPAEVAMPLSVVHPEMLLSMQDFYETAGLRSLLRRIPKATVMTLRKLLGKQNG